MLNLIDNFLNKITMYRLTLYYLISLLLISGVLSILGILPYSPLDLLFSTLFITAVCYLTNHLFSYVFRAQANQESLYITALILVLIISPVNPLARLPFLFWVSVLAMSSKFILAIGNKHIFNPAALAVAVTAVFIGNSANWWVGNPAILPFVLGGGLLIVRKIRRRELLTSFLGAALISIIIFGGLKGTDVIKSIRETLLYSPIFFFAFVMLTEPLTTPPTKRLQIYYGALVGLIFSPNFHLGELYFTPELTLLVGNVFSYLVSPKAKLLMTLKERIKLAPDIYNFVFQADKKLDFKPGQYLEWTFSHNGVDTRGNRRYFTIASSPTEPTLDFGLKFYQPASSFKTNLLAIRSGAEIIGGSLAGDFTLPIDKGQKLVFIAGGIGITPFRSMIKYLLDRNERRDIVLFYINKSADEIVYRDVLDQAQNSLGIKVIYIVGRIETSLIRQDVPDFSGRLFYLSGPHSLVTDYEETLTKLGLSKKQIKVDYFPGFA